LGQVLALPRGKAGVIEDDFALGTLLDEFEAGNGVDPRVPIGHAPGLHDPAGGYEFDVTAGDVPAVEGEGAAHLGADVYGLVAELRARFGGGVVFDSLGERCGSAD